MYSTAVHINCHSTAFHRKTTVLLCNFENECMFLLSCNVSIIGVTPCNFLAEFLFFFFFLAFLKGATPRGCLVQTALKVVLRQLN